MRTPRNRLLTPSISDRIHDCDILAVTDCCWRVHLILCIAEMGGVAKEIFSWALSRLTRFLYVELQRCIYNSTILDVPVPFDDGQAFSRLRHFCDDCINETRTLRRYAQCGHLSLRPFSIEDKSKSKKCNSPNILLKHFTLASSIDAKVSKITKAKVKNHHLMASNILLQILSSI